MNKEEVLEILKNAIDFETHGMLEYEVDALQYAIHFLESAEEVEK